jgi:hypothetical protein
MVQKEVRFSPEEEARRAGRIFAEGSGGGVAFRRVNDPGAGAVGQGIIIRKYGVMAEEAHPPVECHPDNITMLIDQGTTQRHSAELGVGRAARGSFVRVRRYHPMPAQSGFEYLPTKR